MRAQKTIKGEYYHLYNNAMSGTELFRDDEDRARFLFLILHLQSPVIFNHLSRPIPYFLKHGSFETSEYTAKAITKGRYVELVSFVLLPDRFHLIVKEVKEGGIPYFMQRVLNAYSKFFNTKYKRRGHLFQGPYIYRLIADDKQLAELSAHLHSKVKSLPDWKGQEILYAWSSFQDYSKNRFGTLLAHETITEKFKNEKQYKKFVLNPSLKARKIILGSTHLFDEDIK